MIYSAAVILLRAIVCYCCPRPYSAARITTRESCAMVARSRGKAYLATEGGQPIIRKGDENNSGRTRHIATAAAKI